MANDKLNVLAFNCSLKSAAGSEKSSTDALLKQLLAELKRHGADCEIIRAVDHNIKPGVTSDEGEIGEAMGSKEYKDLLKTPRPVAEWNPMLASNAVHLARLLKERKYPGL
jgi:multimeric flavodoxin WrbA